MPMISFRVSDDLLKQLDELVDKQNLKRSEYLVTLVKKGVGAYENDEDLLQERLNWGNDSMMDVGGQVDHDFIPKLVEILAKNPNATGIREAVDLLVSPYSDLQGTALELTEQVLQMQRELHEANIKVEELAAQLAKIDSKGLAELSSIKLSEQDIRRWVLQQRLRKIEGFEITDEFVDQWLEEHKDDPIDDGQIERIRQSFQQKLRVDPAGAGSKTIATEAHWEGDSMVIDQVNEIFEDPNE